MTRNTILSTSCGREADEADQLGMPIDEDLLA